MIDEEKKRKSDAQKEKVRNRFKAKIDRDNYEFIPAKKQIDYYDNDVAQRVAIYARVSTENIQQTSSYELQKKYYEDFVQRHPNWTLTRIYADEGISGTSLAHRDAFNRMIAECGAGKVDIIITKSVSRFARNVVDCISIVRMLAELPHPVGVFFESECIFSLKDDSQMALTFQATMAQEESHVRSRSMESSLRMRLDGGLPLTPKLLGYGHDAEGNLIINPSEASTVKLIFYMYLYGYTTTEIADMLTDIGRKTYLGNLRWSSSVVVQILRNERHCGDVRTRKTFTPNYLTHKAKRNKGDRPQSIYRNHHEAIISRDDFIAVQHLLDNAKYGNKSILPELRVIDSGLLKGFVSVNPRWAGFKAEDYYQASASALHSPSEEEAESDNKGKEADTRITVFAGDFDMRGFEIARTELLDTYHRPNVTFFGHTITFNTACVRKFGKNNRVELLINPYSRQFAVRPASTDNRNAVIWSRASNGIFYPRDIACAAFMDTIYKLFTWNSDLKYRMTGCLFQKDEELVYLFESKDAEVFLRTDLWALKENPEQPGELLSMSGKRVLAVPEDWVNTFGYQYYRHQYEFPPLESQTEADWRLRMEGRLFEPGKKIRVTGFEELKSFIQQELSQRNQEE